MEYICIKARTLRFWMQIKWVTNDGDRSGVQFFFSTIFATKHKKWKSSFVRLVSNGNRRCCHRISPRAASWTLHRALAASLHANGLHARWHPWPIYDLRASLTLVLLSPSFISRTHDLSRPRYHALFISRQKIRWVENSGGDCRSVSLAELIWLGVGSGGDDDAGLLS